MNGPSKIEAGRSAEEAARRILESKGYIFVASNYRTRLGEVDIIMKDGETWVFVEVRSRSSSFFGLPQETVTLRKQKKVIKAAVEFIKSRGEKFPNLRFDVVSLEPDNQEHIPNAFSPPPGLYYI